ncbi:MAG: tetratricopeptide repeat protein, partial [Planctomycetota bacterium]
AVLEKDPDNVQARRWRGHCRNALGMHAQALVDYDRALRLAPAHAWSWYARGMAKHHLNRFREAVTDYSKCLELDPKSHKAVEWRGYNKALLGDHLGCYLDLTRAVALDPENPWVYFTRGRSLCSLGDLRRAQQDFKTTARLDPKHADAHAQLGFLGVATGDDAAALRSFDKAIALDTKGMEYSRLWRYWLRVSAGKPGDKARRELPTKDWPGDLAKVLVGDMTQEQLMEALTIYQINPEELIARRCEAAFYLGLRAELAKAPDRAHEHFKEVLALGDSTIPEWRAARRLARVR